MKKIFAIIVGLSFAANVHSATHFGTSYPFIETNTPANRISAGVLTAETITNMINAALLELNSNSNNILTILPLYADTNGNYMANFTNSCWKLEATNDISFAYSSNRASLATTIKFTSIHITNTTGGDVIIDYNANWHVLGGQYTNLPSGYNLILSCYEINPHTENDVYVGWATDDPNYTVAVNPIVNTGDDFKFNTNLVISMINSSNAVQDLYLYDTNNVNTQITNVFNVLHALADAENYLYDTNAVLTSITNIHNALGGSGVDTNAVNALIQVAMDDLLSTTNYWTNLQIFNGGIEIPGGNPTNYVEVGPATPVFNVGTNGITYALNGSGIQQIQGSNIVAGTVNSNAMDAATLALFVAGGGGSGVGNVVTNAASHNNYSDTSTNTFSGPTYFDNAELEPGLLRLNGDGLLTIDVIDYIDNTELEDTTNSLINFTVPTLIGAATNTVSSGLITRMDNSTNTVSSGLITRMDNSTNTVSSGLISRMDASTNSIMANSVPAYVLASTNAVFQAATNTIMGTHVPNYVNGRTNEFYETSMQYSTNTWSGPTNNFNFTYTQRYQFYTALLNCAITNFNNTIANRENWGVLALTNASGSNLQFYVDPAIFKIFPVTGTNQVTFTNGQVLIFSASQDAFGAKGFITRNKQ